MVEKLTKYFLRGALIMVPLIATAWVLVFTLRFVDGLVPLKVPGLGVAITFVSIVLVGFLGSNVVGARVLKGVEAALTKTPLVRIVYGSLRDLLDAFVGDKKSFDKPVVVTLDATGPVLALGFVTCEHFDDATLAGMVAVYLPQSYNFAGNLVLVPRTRVARIDADKAQFMAFIVSGGVAQMNAASTIMDRPLVLRP